MNPFDKLAKPPVKPRPKPKPKHGKQRIWPDPSGNQSRSLSEILDEKCAGEDPGDDLYWADKD
jgi:hypothetical protein